MMPLTRTDGPIVHLRLGVLFGFLWLLASFHLLVILHDEIWPHGWPAIVMSAIPPSAPVFQVMWGHHGAAAVFGTPAAAVVVAWGIAARRPEARGWYNLARAAVVLYWLVYDFALAFGA